MLMMTPSVKMKPPQKDVIDLSWIKRYEIYLMVGSYPMCTGNWRRASARVAHTPSSQLFHNTLEYFWDSPILAFLFALSVRIGSWKLNFKNSILFGRNAPKNTPQYEEDFGRIRRNTKKILGVGYGFKRDLY